MDQGTNTIREEGRHGADADERAQATGEIRAGIEQTRAEMGETIDAIQDRLRPDHVKEQVKEQIKEQFQEAKHVVREATIGKVEDMVHATGETINEARYTIMDTIRENPIPAALVGIGLGWMYVNRRRTPSYSSRRYYNQYGQRGNQGYYASQGAYADSGRYGQSQRGIGGAVGDVASKAQERVGDITDRAQAAVGNVVDQAQETAGNIAYQAQETAGNIVDQAQETASNIAYQARHQAQRVEDRFQYQLRENPLAVGVLALALGTAIGLAVPETRAEHEFMGEARDKLVDKAQEVARTTMDKVQRVAGDVMEEAQTAVQDRMQDNGGTSSSSQGRGQASGSTSTQKQT
jgi:hypothetical protein